MQIPCRFIKISMENVTVFGGMCLPLELFDCTVIITSEQTEYCPECWNWMARSGSNYTVPPPT
ncbi:hypothetical protein B7P43_G11489 [Cryptotermes secundus]|uniref:Uncharacterized protein n=1 Tax=Cryptotermes secundus TaxID=105785 RepID=A0A2J7RRI3_9NEOP|nr:hypothetical protein B7P43_G11489 [Cryptotermes secundus]